MFTIEFNMYQTLAIAVVMLTSARSSSVEFNSLKLFVSRRRSWAVCFSPL